jgi:hypothetical protein
VSRFDTLGRFRPSRRCCQKTGEITNSIQVDTDHSVTASRDKRDKRVMSCMTRPKCLCDMVVTTRPKPVPDREQAGLWSFRDARPLWSVHPDPLFGLAREMHNGLLRSWGPSRLAVRRITAGCDRPSGSVGFRTGRFHGSLLATNTSRGESGPDSGPIPRPVKLVRHAGPTVSHRVSPLESCP